ncbi:MAG: hypothetical protein B7Y25_06810 [Alphaproteobacteria bacterium 16-39-46]|nr:MAG: hypothetical protein B7Y25_06810 [Alphaproteobacteria bacterium 16-39-46]OZA42069.1 MAG: hypothetical protein B7X84_06975 [Alphaproteobacteria bacterium 17-39-52]
MKELLHEKFFKQKREKDPFNIFPFYTILCRETTNLSKSAQFIVSRLLKTRKFLDEKSLRYS